ncbi:hypothetical protein AGR5A_Lc10053 [Agrobacterium genomosp. 5 str. CFBP 6626]|nr:hypothetical protein AGR5A_Lc10053 [Agrobacterium genomosp. 5 str. CFBP 6626]
MIDHVPDFIYAKDLEGRFLFANRAIVSENGFDTVEELIGLTDADIHGDAAKLAGIPDTEARVMRTGEPDLGYEERAMRGDIDRWLMMSRVPLKDKAGNIIGVVGASRDITQKKSLGETAAGAGARSRNDRCGCAYRGLSRGIRHGHRKSRHRACLCRAGVRCGGG